MLLDLYFHHNGDSKSRAQVNNRLRSPEQQAAYWVLERELKTKETSSEAPQVFESVTELPDGSAFVGLPPVKRKATVEAVRTTPTQFEQTPPLHVSCLLLQTFVVPSVECIITAYVPVEYDLTDLEILLLFS